ncbi:hypothetical protein ACJ5M5_004514 [Vibrio alginolyticus]
MRKIFDSAVVLASGTAVLYCTSTAYYHGYLSFMELDSDLLDRNLHQVLYHGLLISLTPVLRFLLALTVITSVIAYIFAPIWVNFLKKSTRNKRTFFKVRDALFGKCKESQWEKRMKKNFRSSGWLLFAFVVPLLFLVYVESLGRERAEKIKIEINNKEYKKSSIVRTEGKAPKDLYLLACGSRVCAGVDVNTKTVYYFEPKNISFPSSQI